MGVKPWRDVHVVYFLERVALLAFGGLLDFVGEAAGAFAPFFVALGLAGLTYEQN